ncbi:unnamed protein product [Orchesella dallaii]|uniref:C2H2-type domain-containing protein n=1 Tax=Orchesella dallaii TaxID=48710 RepID=A0ABP1QYP0_9HEXA
MVNELPTQMDTQHDADDEDEGEFQTQDDFLLRFIPTQALSNQEPDVLAEETDEDVAESDGINSITIVPETQVSQAPRSKRVREEDNVPGPSKRVRDIFEDVDATDEYINECQEEMSDVSSVGSHDLSDEDLEPEFSVRSTHKARSLRSATLRAFGPRSAPLARFVRDVQIGHGLSSNTTSSSSTSSSGSSYPSEDSFPNFPYADQDSGNDPFTKVNNIIVLRSRECAFCTDKFSCPGALLEHVRVMPSEMYKTYLENLENQIGLGLQETAALPDLKFIEQERGFGGMTTAYRAVIPEDIDNDIVKDMSYFIKRLDEHTHNGSGWSHKRVVDFKVSMVRCKPLSGGSSDPQWSSDFLPELIKKKRAAIINVTGTHNDQHCFAHAILCHFEMLKFKLQVELREKENIKNKKFSKADGYDDSAYEKRIMQLKKKLDKGDKKLLKDLGNDKAKLDFIVKQIGTTQIESEDEVDDSEDEDNPPPPPPPPKAEDKKPNRQNERKAKQQEIRDHCNPLHV